MDWQEIISLIIVVCTAVLLLKSFLGGQKKSKGCAHCAASQIKNSITYVQHK